MSTIAIHPIPNEPVLFLPHQKMLVVADLHIGIEQEFREQGLYIPSQTKTLSHRLLTLLKQYRPKDIVLLGDIKHTIPSSSREERSDVTRFLEILQSHTSIHIIPGNHDGNIQSLVPESISLHSSSGFLCGDVGFVHGHRWPHKDIMSCKHLIIGHTHPTIQLTDRLGCKTFEPCWLRGKLSAEKVLKRYSHFPDSEVIIMPAYHPLCGGVAANVSPLIGPLASSIDIGTAQVYLLDGSFLGTIQKIQ